MFVAIHVYGVDETGDRGDGHILTEVGETVAYADLYEGHAAVKLCATQDEAEAFLADWAGTKGDDDDDDDDDEDGDDEDGDEDIFGRQIRQVLDLSPDQDQ